MADKALIIIPTYNEIENITLIVKAVLSQNNSYHVLVIDDGSPDGTANAVIELQQEYHEKVALIQRPRKSGLGTAYIRGFKYGIEHQYDYIIEMDADFSHEPSKVPSLIGACKAGADVAVGSRYVKGGGIKDWPMDRLILSYGASLFVRAITWMPVKDTTAGFVCYKRSVLETMRLDEVKFVGYAFQIEMKYTLYRLGYKIVEVPIIFKDRVRGDSKMDTSIVKEAILGVFGMRFRSYTKVGS